MTAEHGPDLQKEAQEEEWKKVAEELYGCTVRALQAASSEDINQAERFYAVLKEIEKLRTMVLEREKIPQEYYAEFAKQREGLNR